MSKPSKSTDFAGLNTKRARRRLFSRNPKCFWCGVLTVWETPSDGILSDVAATVDHLDSRFHRTEDWGEVVLSCYKCNHERARDESLELVEKMTKEERVARWGNGGKNGQGRTA